MHVSPPRRMPRIADSTLARLPALRRVGATTTSDDVSKSTTVIVSPSRMRCTMPTPASIARAMRSPFIEPDLSTTIARFSGGAACGASAPATDAKKIRLARVALGERSVTETRLDVHGLTGREVRAVDEGRGLRGRGFRGRSRRSSSGAVRKRRP